LSYVKSHEDFSINSWRNQLLWWDDFLGDRVQDEYSIGGDAGGSGVVVDGETGGVIRITCDGDDGDDYQIFWGNYTTIINTKLPKFEARVKLETASNISVDFLGFYGTLNSSRAMFWCNTDVDANWHFQTRDAAGQTNTDTGIALDTSYHIFRISFISSTQVLAYIDGTEEADHSTNIPTDHMFIDLKIGTEENATKYVDMDYWVVAQDI